MPHIFQAALRAYRNESGRRKRGLAEDALAAIDERVDFQFWNMVRTPARTVGNTVLKGSAMLDEYGGAGHLQTDLVECLIGDLRAIDGGVQNAS